MVVAITRLIYKTHISGEIGFQRIPDELVKGAKRLEGQADNNLVNCLKINITLSTSFL